MIIAVLISCFLTIIAILSSGNYIFAQYSGDETGIYSLEEELELAKSKILMKGTNETTEKENNETAEYEWKTCSERRFGFSIEYPTHWLDSRDYTDLYDELNKEYYEKRGWEYPTKIESNDTDAYYWCIFYAFPKEYGNSIEEIKEKIREKIRQEIIDHGYFIGGLPYHIRFQGYTDRNFSTSIEETYDRFFPFDPPKYYSLKVLTRLLALIDNNNGYDLVEKPNFEKYSRDNMKTGSYSIKDDGSEYEKNNYFT